MQLYYLFMRKNLVILCIMYYTLRYTLTISVKIILYRLYKGNVTRPRMFKFGRYRAYSNFLIKFYTCVFLLHILTS